MRNDTDNNFSSRTRSLGCKTQFSDLIVSSAHTSSSPLAQFEVEGPGALYGHVGEMGDLRSGSGRGERSLGIWGEEVCLRAGIRSERQPPTQTRSPRNLDLEIWKSV